MDEQEEEEDTLTTVFPYSPISFGNSDVPLFSQPVLFHRFSLHPGHEANTGVLVPLGHGRQRFLSVVHT